MEVRGTNRPRGMGVRAWTLTVLLALTGTLLAMNTEVVYADDLPSLASAPSLEFPTVPAEHRHVRALLENALRYIAPPGAIVDEASGYVVEGWNDDPQSGLNLRSFTQLTAIGEWMELLGNIAANYVNTPYCSRQQALDRLAQVVQSLKTDQQDPALSHRGLLGNFLALSDGRRLGPLCGDVEKTSFISTFGEAKGQAVWEALELVGWITPRSNGRVAAVCRGARYGTAYFDGPLSVFNDDTTKTQIMEILDQRVAMVVFGDNANLTTSVGKAIGALLAPAVKDDPLAARLRQEMDEFLEIQREGYAHLYDGSVGLFSFGWDNTHGRFSGWEDGQGSWLRGHMDYLVNEFRGPTTFVVLRYGLPMTAVSNLGFKIKPYRLASGEDAYVLAPWEGSAFQALGLGLAMSELEHPVWRKILKNTVAVEIDYARRNQLPGFLSESYTGDGTLYTGDVGIPDIAVTAMPRLTHAASLYTLGIAYMVSPAEVEMFLAANWPTISKMLTDHGPWEGFHRVRGEPVYVQTSAHTLSLVLGLLGTGSENMRRYLDSRGLGERLREIHGSGQPIDLLADDTEVFAWDEAGTPITTKREPDGFHVHGEPIQRLDVAFVPRSSQGADLRGGTLTLRYRSTQAFDRATIAFKPTGTGPASAPKIADEVITSLADTGGHEQQISIPLPATPGLASIKEVVLTCRPANAHTTADVSFTHASFAPDRP
jgi:hypothetical protein